MNLYNPTKISWDGISDQKLSKIVGHRAVWDRFLKEVPETNYPTDTIVPINNWTVNSINNDGDNTNCLAVYTDGSKINDRAGNGWVITRGEGIIQESYEFSGDSSVFYNELTAIQGALLWSSANINSIKTKTVRIFSDSQSAIGALFASTINSRLVKEISDLYTSLNKDINISVTWVKGHANNTGNEYADYLAKRGGNAE